MRYAKLAFAFLGFAAVLVAADPFAGTWKLDQAKSKYRTGTPPKEQTITIVESGSDLDITIKGTAADATPISAHYTVPAAGGEGKIIKFPYEGVSGRRVSTHQREVSYSKGPFALRLPEQILRHWTVRRVRSTNWRSTPTPESKFDTPPSQD